MPAQRKRSPPEQTIIGIDPGVAIVGYAVIRTTREVLTPLACDVIRTSPKTPLPDRLLSIYEQLCQLLTVYQPAEAAVEDLFFGKNRKTAIAVAHASGVIMLALRRRNLPIATYSPTQVKLAVTGYGGAQKAQVGEMVRRLLALESIPKPDDAADAAAVAICHAHTMAWHATLRTAHS